MPPARLMTSRICIFVNPLVRPSSHKMGRSKLKIMGGSPCTLFSNHSHKPAGRSERKNAVWPSEEKNSLDTIITPAVGTPQGKPGKRQKRSEKEYFGQKKIVQRGFFGHKSGLFGKKIAKRGPSPKGRRRAGYVFGKISCFPAPQGLPERAGRWHRRRPSKASQSPRTHDRGRGNPQSGPHRPSLQCSR